MKNFQKLSLALVVAIMAIGFSAFKNANNGNIKFNKNAKGEVVSVTYPYYNLDGDPTNEDPENFVYRDGTTDADCNILLDMECQATWTTDLPPANNQNPEQASPITVPVLDEHGPIDFVYNGE